jgi:subtilisin-like proprotein convertase family protein
MKKIVLTICVLLLVNILLKAQLSVSGGFTAQQLASHIAGPNITVYNATITGAPISYGKFNTGATSTNLGMRSGIVLNPGSRAGVIGPNGNPGETTNNGTPGDAQLNGVAGVQTNDACVLQFQFDVQSESIEFKYVFGSDEYPEYVNAGFNDVFAFYISGPGITGWQNIALVPNTTTPVTIDNINDGSYWQYYVNNENGTTIEYDGFTRSLVAKKTGLIPCQTYTLRLAIADAGDDFIDSGVFLEEGSLKQGTISAITQTINADSVALEGCTKAKFVFSLDTAQSTNTQIDFEILGSAINGVDYQHIDTLFILPAGQTSATITIDAINDGLTEGLENIFLVYTPFPCAPKDTVKLYINDYLNLQYENTVTNVSCFNANNGIVNFTTTGGSAPFTYNFTNAATGSVITYTTNPITGLSPGSYNITVADGYGCAAADIVVGNQYTGGPVFLPDGTGLSYSTSLPISGFSAGATLQSINQLQSICMNMEHSRIGELEIKLVAPNGQQVILKQQPGGAVCNMGEPCANGPADPGNPDTSPGIGYTYCFSANPTYGTMASEANAYTYSYTNVCDGSTQSDKYLPSGSYTSSASLNGLIGAPLNGNWTLVITDNIPNNNGWVFDWSISFAADPPDSIITITQPTGPTVTNTNVQPNCGASTGSINITVTGTTSPYTYLWSNGATTQDINNVPAGSYTVGIIDVNACLYNYPVLLSNNGTLALTSIVTNVLCNNASNGAINLIPTGGTGAYTYSWSNGATSQDISSLVAGTYTATVTDGASCIGVHSATVIQPTQINYTSSVLNETCGNENGEIFLTVFGGTTPYSYLWSNGSIAEDPNYLQAGTYSVTIRDANNCARTANFTLINEVASCSISCDVAIGSSVITNETCGNDNGAIDVSIVNGLQPFQYTWSGGSTTQDISGLYAGTYSLTVTDSKNCTATQTFVVTNNTGTLAATAVVTNETCGNIAGAINQTIFGGTLPYTILWNNGSANEDRTALTAGTYSVNITDANGCVVSNTYTVINNTNTLVQTYGNALNETCSNQTGSIDITIAGGASPYSYAWSNGANTQDLMNIGAGIYTCTVTASNGCKLYTPSYTVLNNSGTLAIFDIDVLDEVCGNGAGRLNVDIVGGNTPYSYLWSTSQTTQAINNLSSGNYSCVITDNSGCSVSTGQLTVANASGTLAITSVISTNETCGNQQGAINLSITGGAAPIAFAWNNGITTEDISNIVAGSYNCTITDVNGCSVSINAIIANTSGTLAVSTPSSTNETCGNSNGSVSITVTGGNAPITYTWSNGSVTEDLTALAAGTYSCEITDAFGCVVTTNASITNIAGTMNTSFTTVNENCNNNNGSINLTVTGGTPPYTYLWSNGATTQDISGLTMGTYSCSINDATNCEINTALISINDLAGTLAVASSTVTNENCGNGVGAINITVSGGVIPYTYSWSNGATTEDISGLSAGVYSVTVLGANGCSTVRTFTVQNLSGTFVYTGQTTTQEVCGNAQGAINISFSGGSGAMTYLWSNGATTEDISGLSAGTYSVEITDASGCSIASSNIVISNSSGTLIVSAPATQNEECGNAQGIINISVSGGTGAYTYTWSNGATTEDLSGLSSGTYSCVVSDAANCTYIVNATILNGAGTLTITNSVVNNATCGSLGSINLTTIGAAPIVYAWSNGAPTEDISALAAGTYSCSITDGAGCSTTFSASINASSSPIITINTVTNDNCGQNTGAINISVANGVPNYTYAWNNGATTQDLNTLPAGTYSCIVTDAAGCKDTVTAVVITNAPFSAVGVVTNATCVFCNDGSINVTTTNGSGNALQYYWDPVGTTMEDLTGAAPGTYTLYVYDNFGCFINYTFTVGFGVGITQQNTTNNFFRVHPNPSSGMLTVDFNASTENNVAIEIINTLGEVLETISLQKEDIQKQTIEINLSEKANGVYYLKMKEEDRTSIQKIIISK